MSLRTKFKLTLPKTPITDPAKAEAAAQQALLPAIESATLLLHSSVTELTPVGATGIARGSIQSGVETIRGTVTTYRGRVMSAAPHIVPLEEGSKPHWAPIAPLKRWARIVLGDEGAAWAVQRAIARRGTKGRHMFRDAAKLEGPAIERILRQGIANWIRRLGGKG